MSGTQSLPLAPSNSVPVASNHLRTNETMHFWDIGARLICLELFGCQHLINSVVFGSEWGILDLTIYQPW